MYAAPIFFCACRRASTPELRRSDKFARTHCTSNRNRRCARRAPATTDLPSRLQTNQVADRRWDTLCIWHSEYIADPAFRHGDRAHRARFHSRGAMIAIVHRARRRGPVARRSVAPASLARCWWRSRWGRLRWEVRSLKSAYKILSLCPSRLCGQGLYNLNRRECRSSPNGVRIGLRRARHPPPRPENAKNRADDDFNGRVSEEFAQTILADGVSLK